jgi:DNA-binding FadR family transcriptional regulator
MSEETVENTQEAQVPQQEQTAAEQAQSAELNLNDLASIRSVLDVASQRGAFKANELEAVGKIYNKLNSFLEAVTKKEQQ